MHNHCMCVVSLEHEDTRLYSDHRAQGGGRDVMISCGPRLSEPVLSSFFPSWFTFLFSFSQPFLTCRFFSAQTNVIREATGPLSYGELESEPQQLPVEDVVFAEQLLLRQN